MASSSRAPKHVWTKEEEATLVECMVELVSAGGWKSDNGTFRQGYVTQLIRMMAAKLSKCNVHATTVIDCRIKTLKRSYQAIAEMRNPSCSGFGWNDDAKRIVAEKELIDNWVKSHSAAKDLLNKPFSYYDDLSYVFGKDLATGARAYLPMSDQMFLLGSRNLHVDLNDVEIPSMSSHVFNMSPTTSHDLIEEAIVGSVRESQSKSGEDRIWKQLMSLRMS